MLQIFKGRSKKNLTSDAELTTAQTTPAKMLNSNVGLRDICYSVTGGALVAQGECEVWPCVLIPDG